MVMPAVSAANVRSSNLKEGAMAGVRIAISVFLVILISLVIRGWIWTAAHQPAGQAAASHVVLGIAGLAGVVALVLIWRWDPTGRGSSRP
jgi:hypothetical protein